MARGWESKDVESQQSLREKEGRSGGPRSPEQQRRNHLLLQRARLLDELQRACNPRFRGQLETEIAWVDTELSKLGDGGT